MPMHSMPRSRYFLIPCFYLSIAAIVGGAPPLWWSDGIPPVITPGAPENNRGPANIGQAKHMAKRALEKLATLDPVLADQIENQLVGAGKPISSLEVPPDPKPADWADNQRAPLLLGQLKAIAAPFYDALYLVDPIWLAEQCTLNGTATSGSIYPWTAETTDDANKAPATIGQLKAVFSLRFENVTLVSLLDSDGDGLSDEAEASLGTSPTDPDTDNDGIPDGADSAPLTPNTVPLAEATTLMIWMPVE